MLGPQSPPHPPSTLGRIQLGAATLAHTERAVLLSKTLSKTVDELEKKRKYIGPVEGPGKKHDNRKNTGPKKQPGSLHEPFGRDF